MASGSETNDEKLQEKTRVEPTLTLEWLTPEELEDNPRNWRTHPAAQRRALADVIGEVGWAGALLYNRRTRRLIDGHARKKVAKAGERMPVLIGEWSEEQELKLLATLDPLSAMAGADDERLAEILKEVETSSDAVKKMLAGLARGAGIDLSGAESDVDAEAQIGRADELRKQWGTELGQLWILGDHRLLCGDSTSSADVQRLMSGERAVLFATDPPYLVDYDGTNHPGVQGKTRPSKNKDWSNTYRDFDRAEQGDGLYDGFISVAVEHAIRADAAWYCWHASRRQAMVEAAWERHGAFVHQQIIWTKDRAVLTRSWYLWQHEPCFFGWVKGQKPPRVAAASPLASVWTLQSVSRTEDIDHPTPKPVECFAIPMRQHTEIGDVCYEPFCGSGSQIIAAEQTGRRCFAMELAPEFVAVSLQRYLDATGKTPVLAEEVAA
jgi:DNA modification methylase